MSFASLISSSKTAVQKFAHDETGATAIEYGLIAGLISVAILAVLGLIGTNLSGLFTKIQTQLQTAAAT